jgi:hypothetical protein
MHAVRSIMTPLAAAALGAGGALLFAPQSGTRTPARSGTRQRT